MNDWPDGMLLRDRLWVRWQALKWRWKLWRERREEDKRVLASESNDG